LRVWRGRVLKKRKEQMEEVEDIGREGFGRLIFLHNTKLSSFEELKIVFEKGFGGFYEFFKFNLCCYNIFKIKNIIIININLSLLKIFLKYNF